MVPVNAYESLAVLPDQRNLILQTLRKRKNVKINFDAIIIQFSLLIRITMIFPSNFRRPHAWYPVARQKKRKVTLHVGPTNSGKTYHALKQLELSSSGMYIHALSGAFDCPI